jgi:hypothetical protein
MIRLNIIDRKLMALGELGMTWWKAWPLWVTIASIMVPEFVPYLLLEDRILRLGVVYQILGWSSVTYGFLSKLKFAKRNVFQQIWLWFKEMFWNLRVLIYKPKPNYRNMQAFAHGDAGMATGIIRGKRDYSQLPVEEQVKVMWEEQRKLEERIDAVDAIHRASAAKLEKMIEDKAKEVIARMDESREDLNDFLVGDYKWEIAGLMVTLVGIVYGSLPKDIFALFAR